MAAPAGRRRARGRPAALGCATPAGHFRAYTRGEIDFATQRRRRAADLHAAFGGPALDAPSAARWDATYETAFRAAWRPCEDAARLLGRLAAADLPVAAVTNMLTAYQRRKLAVVGLLNGVSAVVGIDAVGVGKPDPRMFHQACRRLGVSAQEAAYVGDELDVDARGARDAGLLGIWLDRHGAARRPSTSRSCAPSTTCRPSSAWPEAPEPGDLGATAARR